MGQLCRRIVLALILVGVASSSAAPQTNSSAAPAAREPSLGERIDAAVARGVKYLYSQQQPNGTFPPFKTHTGDVFPNGSDVMAMAALIYAGEPITKPEMAKGLKALLEMDLQHTYTLGFRIVALAELYRRSDPELKASLRTAMRRDAMVLADFQLGNGAWSYGKRADDEAWDFSNTQIGLLGLQQAVSCGVEVPLSVFQKAQAHYLKMQLNDGGWNYNDIGPNIRVPSYGSMTAAAVANLMLTRTLLNPGQGCPCRGGRSGGRRSAQLDRAIERGTTWLGDTFAAGEIPKKTAGIASTSYWWYAAERVGIASGYKYLGKHNWYRAIAGTILHRQQANGAVGRDLPDTAFSLLFLIKGRGPILVNKLKFDGVWNPHPGDAENLARYVGEIKEQTILWQIIHLDAPVEELHDAPILYISAESALTLSDEHKKKLREFTDTGGTILFEASCGNPAADASWRRTCGEVWPEWELKTVEKDHPLFSCDAQIAGPMPPLLAASDGLRSFLFYAPRDISCAWNTMAVARSRAVFDLGINLYAYSTDRGKLRDKLAGRDAEREGRYAGQTPTAADKAPLVVARIKHGGEWYLGRNYRPWPLLAESLKAKAGIELREAEPVASGQAPPAGTGVLYLSGRTSCDLGAEGGPWLKTFVSGGGWLLAEAVLGDARFDEPVRATLAAAGLTVKPLPADSGVITGRVPGGATGYDVSRVGYTMSLLPERIGKPGPHLFGIYSGDALVGVYSPYDILFSQTGCKAYGSRGYAADDARALATNLVLLLTARR